MKGLRPHGDAGPLKHFVKVGFQCFGWMLLAREAGRSGTSIASLLRRAAIHYESRLHLQCAARLVPPFARAEGPTPRVFGFQLDDRTCLALTAEAERQSVELERLLEHAALCYLADIDRGLETRHMRLVPDPVPQAPAAASLPADGSWAAEPVRVTVEAPSPEVAETAYRSLGASAQDSATGGEGPLSSL